MIITVIGKYKSLKSFKSENLTSFAVITGKNGSGKTQLLELLYTKYSNQNISGVSVNVEPRVMAIHNSGLIINQLNPSKNINKEIPQLIALLKRDFAELKFYEKQLIELLVENNISIDEFIEMAFSSFESKLSSNVDVETLFKHLRVEYPVGYANNSSTPDVKKEAVNNLLKQKRNFLDILLYIISKKNKKVADINGDDFDSIDLPEKYLDSNYLFASNLAVIFIAYARRRYQNEMNYFHKEVYKENNDSISDIDFLSTNRPPWEMVNEILNERGMVYEFDGYDRSTKPEFVDTELLLRNKVTRDLVKIQDLSSGEKIIIGLVIRLFAISYYNDTKLTFPELLLLDEEDAYLHPEMSNLLIDVLYKTFVQKLGIKVIMTTHSPSTIALTPDECIFEMRNNPDCSLKNISKDEALNILTGNIPTLSIDYQNQRQVFVESNTDVLYFQRLFEKINSNAHVSHKLYFISNQKGKGNCDWVKEIVQKLRDNGVNKIYGIIDWDTKNDPSDNIFVHGHKTVYSLENFLLDGIYLAILLLEMNAHNIRQELNFLDTYMEYGIINENQSRLQYIWDWIIAKVENNFPTLKNKETIDKQYYNEKIVKVPDWLLKSKGHDLEQKFKTVFPALEKFQNEGELQEKLSLIMAKCYPLVPIESIELLKKICI